MKDKELRIILANMNLIAKPKEKYVTEGESATWILHSKIRNHEHKISELQRQVYTLTNKLTKLIDHFDLECKHQEETFYYGKK